MRRVLCWVRWHGWVMYAVQEHPPQTRDIPEFPDGRARGLLGAAYFVCQHCGETYERQIWGRQRWVFGEEATGGSEA